MGRANFAKQYKESLDEGTREIYLPGSPFHPRKKPRMLAQATCQRSAQRPEKRALVSGDVPRLDCRGPEDRDLPLNSARPRFLQLAGV